MTTDKDRVSDALHPEYVSPPDVVKKAKQRLITEALTLLALERIDGLDLQIPGTSPQLHVVVGEANRIAKWFPSAVAPAVPSPPLSEGLTDERIIQIAEESRTAESRDGDYILPIHFARAVEREVTARLSAPPSPTLHGAVGAGEREAWEKAAQSLGERAAGHYRIGNYELQDECLQCAAMLRDMKPAVTPVSTQSGAAAAQFDEAKLMQLVREFAEVVYGQRRTTEDVGAKLVDYVKSLAAPAATAVPKGLILDRYDAGLLSDYGGGNVEWWQDYLRAELERAHDHYQSQADTAAPSAPKAMQAAPLEAARTFTTFEDWLASDIEPPPGDLTPQQRVIAYARLAFNAGRAGPLEADTTDTAADPVVEANRKLLLDRSRVGISKYGTTLAAAGLSRGQLAQHALEEALDLANYLQTIIQAEAMSASPATKTEGE